MKKVLFSIRIVLKRISRIFKPSSVKPKSMIEDVPYFSQWESPELVEPIINGKFNASDDPNWKRSGADNKNEYATWSASGCGMACFKMILAYETGVVEPLVKLGKKCAEYGGYVLPIENSIGLVYRPFTMFAKREYEIVSTSVLPLLVEEIVEHLSNQKFVVASVSPKIRDVSSRPKTKGGHLVLIVGYDMSKKEFYIHNPSGFTENTQRNVEVSFTDFKKFFGHKGIVFN